MRPHRHRLPIWSWVLTGVGGLGFLVGFIAWLGGEKSPSGDTWLANPDAIILSLIGAVVAIGAPAAASLASIRRSTEQTEDHVVNSHTQKNLRADIDEIKDDLIAVRALSEHAVRAARKSSDDTAQLREDVQQSRKESADNINGLRKDVGRLTDAITKGKS